MILSVLYLVFAVVDGSHDPQRPVCLVSAQQGYSRSVLVWDSVQGECIVHTGHCSNRLTTMARVCVVTFHYSFLCCSRHLGSPICRGLCRMKMLPVMILGYYWQTIIRARGRLFRNAPTRARDSFSNAPTRARNLFRNATTRARDSFSQCSKLSCDSLSNVPIRTRMIASSKSVHSAGFFFTIITFCHSMPFMSMY